MGAGHSHSEVAPRASRRSTIIMASAVAVGIILTIVGAISVWPSDRSFQGSLDTAGAGAQWTEGTVVAFTDDRTTAIVLLDREGQITRPLDISVPQLFDTFEEGDKLILLELEDGTILFSDFARAPVLGWLLVLYIVVVIAVAWWRGAGALLGLAIALGIIMWFTVPSLYLGNDALVVGLTTGAGALVVVLYLAHGINARSTTALLGTLIGLAVTGVLGAWAVASSNLTGIWTEEALTLSYLSDDVSLPGLVLCGVILAGLGVLNDVTITQASAVWELKAARPDISRRELYRRGMRIGRDHIASTIYTIAFAYVGAALPMLMLVSLYAAPAVDSLTTASIAEEVVRTLVGSIGLVLAVPITTLIGALVVGVREEPAEAASDDVDDVDDVEDPDEPEEATHEAHDEEPSTAVAPE